MTPVRESSAERVFATIGTVAQPSFDGQGWLVALNLGIMTAGCALCIMMVGKLVRDLWRCRFIDRIREPATIARLVILLFAIAGVFRFGGEAAALWGWDPTRPEASFAAAQAKRLLDPIAATFTFSALALWIVSERGLLGHLRRRGEPAINMWASLHQLKRPAKVVALCFAAAIGVVSTR